jgi:uncharacterized protein (AIM24 family)
VARRGSDEIDALDEELSFHVGRGSELLARGEADAARASLERARELRPKDAKVLGLLGQAYYRLSRFDDAAEVWQRLVDDNPVEPAARVNLGLAKLKAKRYPEAVKQLEIALDLNPDHRKAIGYLGLALLESGEAAKAREWFRKAGSEQMVARCDEVLAGARPASPPDAPPDGPTEPAESPEPMHTPVPGTVEAHRPAELATAARAAAAPPAAGELAAYAAARLVSAAAEETPFTVGDVLAVSVRGEVRVRLDGVFAARGKVSATGELKRFRGRATETPFGEGLARMYRASGDGVLLYRTAGRRFTALELGDVAAYLREEVVFGFEAGIQFENGRVASSRAAELDLVHLRGRGKLLLATRGEPVAIDVTPDAPLRLPVAALVGWIGALTPRVTALVEDAPDGGTAAVELTGEGRVLADPAAELVVGGSP